VYALYGVLGIEHLECWRLFMLACKIISFALISLQKHDTVHRTDHWTYICDSGNTAQTQACSAPLLYIAPKWCDSGTEAVPTLTVLCDHSEQGSRPDTAEGGLV